VEQIIRQCATINTGDTAAQADVQTELLSDSSSNTSSTRPWQPGLSDSSSGRAAAGPGARLDPWQGRQACLQQEAAKMQQWCKKGPQTLVALFSASQRLLLGLALQATQETVVLTDLPTWVHSAVGQPFMPSTSRPSVIQPMEELSKAARAERTVHVSVRSFTMSQQVRQHLVGCSQLHVPAEQQAAQTTRAGEGAQHIPRTSWHVHPAVWHSHAADSSTASALSRRSSSSSSSSSSSGSTDLTTSSMTAALAFAT
jgi:hypothetical protein